MARGMDKLIILLPKKENLKPCQNYRTISLVSHAIKIMIRVILNRLKNEAEHHLAEENRQDSEQEEAQ